MSKRIRILELLRGNPSPEDLEADGIFRCLAESARPDVVHLRRRVERRLAMPGEGKEGAVKRPVARRICVFAGAAASVVLVLCVLATWETRPPAIVLLALDGTELIEKGRSQPMAQCDPVQLGATIRTESTGMATLLLSDLSRVRLGQSTCVTLGGRRDLSLEFGALFAEVTPLADASRPFRVKAGKVLVTVLGTSFEVTHGADSTEVSVEEGVVRVSGAGQQVVLHGGQTVMFRDGVFAPPKQISPSAVAVWRRELEAAEAKDPTFVDLMRTYFPSRSLDAPAM